MKQRYLYALTFERPETMAPRTVRGEIVAGNPGRALFLAYREALRQVPGRVYWDDIVVLLEKARAGGPDAAP